MDDEAIIQALLALASSPRERKMALLNREADLDAGSSEDGYRIEADINKIRTGPDGPAMDKWRDEARRIR